jgi:histidine triad (HIT) family protein
MDGNCPFCKRIALHEYDWAYGGAVVFEPLNPVTPDHYLAVQLTHVEHALASPLMTGEVMRAASVFAVEIGLKSCNLITSVGTAATQSVQHLHIHVVPRRAGDGLMLPWTGQE